MSDIAGLGRLKSWLSKRKAAFINPQSAQAFGLSPPKGILLLLLYGIGHCAIIVIAGTSAQLVQRYLNWTDRSRGAAILRGVCGVLVILGGLYLIYAAP